MDQKPNIRRCVDVVVVVVAAVLVVFNDVAFFLFSLLGETAGNSVRVHQNLRTSTCT